MATSRQHAGKLHQRADRARLEGRVRKAIRLYRKVLASQPGADARVHRKLAPLLARRRLREEAWQSYQVACSTLSERGFDAQAGGLLREAVMLLPRNPQGWLQLARIEEALGRNVDARNTLIEGRRHFRRRRDRADAIALLSEVQRLDPGSLETGLELATLLRRAGKARRAQEILHQLLQRAPDQARHVRRALFWTRPTFRSLNDWLRCPVGHAWRDSGRLCKNPSD